MNMHSNCINAGWGCGAMIMRVVFVKTIKYILRYCTCRCMCVCSVEFIAEADTNDHEQMKINNSWERNMYYIFKNMITVPTQ